MIDNYSIVISLRVCKYSIKFLDLVCNSIGSILNLLGMWTVPGGSMQALNNSRLPYSLRGTFPLEDQNNKLVLLCSYSHTK